MNISWKSDSSSKTPKNNTDSIKNRVLCSSYHKLYPVYPPVSPIFELPGTWSRNGQQPPAVSSAWRVSSKMHLLVLGNRRVLNRWNLGSSLSWDDQLRTSFPFTFTWIHRYDKPTDGSMWHLTLESFVGSNERTIHQIWVLVDAPSCGVKCKTCSNSPDLVLKHDSGEG